MEDAERSVCIDVYRWLSITLTLLTLRPTYNWALSLDCAACPHFHTTVPHLGTQMSK